MPGPSRYMGEDVHMVDPYMTERFCQILVISCLVGLERAYESDGLGGEDSELKFLKSHLGDVIPTWSILWLQRNLLSLMVVRPRVVESYLVLHLSLSGSFIRGWSGFDDKREEVAWIGTRDEILLRVRESFHDHDP